MMKKLLFGLTCMTAFAACTDDYKDWADPQVNLPEDPQTVEVTVGAVSPVQYATLTADSVQLFVPTVTTNAEAATEYKVVFTNADNANTATLTADEQGRVSAADLKGVVEKLYGKKPEERTLNMDITSYTVIGGVTIANKATSTIKVTLTAPFISEGYYLIGNMNDWDGTKMLDFKFSHSNADVYDDPVFTITFTTTTADQYWKIIPQSNVDADNVWNEGETGVVGVAIDGDDSMEGDLTTNGPGAGKIAEAGIYRMTINMMDYTYKLEKLNFAPYVYFIGATDGWSQPDQRLETANFDGIYTGFVYVADPNGWGIEFKFQRVAGDWGDDSQLNSNNMTAVTGDFEKTNDNFKASAGEGVYYVTIDLAAMTMNGLKVDKMGIIGDFNGWGGDVEMTWNATDFCYEATGAGVTANGWKFRINSDWAINLGGTVDNLVPNGDNLSVVGNTIKLYPTRKTSDKIFCTVE